MNSLFKFICLSTIFLTSFATADSVETAVSQIRANYNATENAKLQSVIIKLDPDAETFELKKYFLNGALVKMVFISGGDHGAYTDSYYFKNGNLYFIYQSGGGWSFDPNGPEGTTIDTGREQRIYFKDGQVIRHLVKEVASRDYNEITKLLGKAANKPVHQPEAANALMNAGYRLANVNTKADLERYAYGE
ncbi:hypothetical protein VSU19_07255 [Verrucomicrobiales bacterium BCK34]|nr:hypothetical protein [Verrucomicrobiales bacterium BCK34]